LASRLAEKEDPCSDERLAELEQRIEKLEKKGWHENANACRRQLEKLRALKATSFKEEKPQT
jgi:hypothetical protein